MHCVASSINKNFLDFDHDSTKHESLRKNGEFVTSFTENLHLDRHLSYYISLKSFTFTGLVLNFDPTLHSATLISTKRQSVRNPNLKLCNIDSLDLYIRKLVGNEIDELLYFEEDMNRIFLQLENKETITFSPMTAKFLGFSHLTYTGPLSKMAERPPDLYSQIRPLLFDFELCANAQVLDSMRPLFGIIDTSQILPHSNSCSTFTVTYPHPSYVLIGKQPPSLYIKSQLYSLSGIISFSSDSEITIHFMIKSTPFDLL